MSILLEALRKSEKSQQSHEAPSIHADDQSGGVSESLQTGPLALLLVVTLFVSGWFVWHQYRPPAGVYQPPVTLTADRVRAVTIPVAGDGEMTQTTSSSAVTDSSARQQRTPVESYQQEVRTASQPKPDKPEPSTDNHPVTQTADGGGNQASSRTVASDKPAAVAQKEYRPQEPAPISYWELPDAIRADLPEIKFSVLVYDNRPTDRFVLVNGQRLREGDSSLPGLVVKEIRRDGVVFSYRLYQFLVER